MPSRILITCLLLGTLCSCATVPQRSPQADMKAAEAYEAVHELQPQMEQFFLDIQPVLGEIRDLDFEPGWEDMRQIIEGSPAILAYVEGTSDQFPSHLPALSQWSSTWGRDWEDLFSKYNRLADRCTILEARRAALRHRILAAQAKYLGAIILQDAAGQAREVQSLWEMLELLERSLEDLDAYSLDSIGLYQVYRGP